MVLCNVWWSGVKGCSYGDCKNYTVDLGDVMRVETERMYLYPLSDEEMRLVIENESDQEMKQAYTEMLEGCLR